MKRITIAIACIVLMGAAQAQTSVNAGYSDMRIKIQGQRAYWQGGMFGGLSHNVTFGEHFGITPGVYLNYARDSRQSTNIFVTTLVYYTEIGIYIPLPVSFRINLSERNFIYAFAGPEINCGILAQEKTWSGSYAGSSMSQKLDYFNEASVGTDETLRRFNVSGIVGIGARFDYLNLMVGIDAPLLSRRLSDSIEERALRIFVGSGIMF